MIFLSLIAVLAIVYLTAYGSILHHDSWFIGFLNKLRALPSASSAPLLPMILALVIPLAVLVVCILAISIWDERDNGPSAFLIFIYVPVLLYSLGRGNFIADVNNYIATATRGDNVMASKIIADMRGQVAVDENDKDVSDWKTLHTQALKVISYRGFERIFAVLFWFFIAGAIGALLYRLSVIYREQTVSNTVEAQLADRWLWLIEWPAVRLMGLTWAFVGNFDSSPWQESLLDTKSSSITILNNNLRGALSAPTDLYRESDEIRDVEARPDTAEEAAEVFAAAAENAQEAIEDLVGVTLSPQVEPAYSFALVRSSVPLYSRSLLFCVGVIAFATLFNITSY
ncbi:MAG: regulatory signaling modulator protein AmpE [Pseudomonadota bacterium]